MRYAGNMLKAFHDVQLKNKVADQIQVHNNGRIKETKLSEGTTDGLVISFGVPTQTKDMPSGNCTICY